MRICQNGYAIEARNNYTDWKKWLIAEGHLQCLRNGVPFLVDPWAIQRSRARKQPEESQWAYKPWCLDHPAQRARVRWDGRHLDALTHCGRNNNTITSKSHSDSRLHSCRFCYLRAPLVSVQRQASPPSPFLHAHSTTLITLFTTYDG